MLHMTEQEYQALLLRRGLRSSSGSPVNKAVPPKKIQPPKSRKPRKYRNNKVYVYEDGFSAAEKMEGHGAVKERFDSVKEYRRCQELRLLERAGRISNLQLQAPLLIASSFTDKDGRKHRAVIYRADFTYEENGREVVEDVKGYSKEKQKYLCTEAFRLKWKMLHQLYPDKEFRLY